MPKKDEPDAFDKLPAENRKIGRREPTEEPIVYYLTNVIIPAKNQSEYEVKPNIEAEMNSISLGDELSDDQLIFPDQKTEFSNQDVEDLLD